MFKKTVLLMLTATGCLLSGLANATDDGRHWNGPGYHGNPGGNFSIHVVPPPRLVPPPHYQPVRCLPGNRVDQLQAEQASRIHAGRQDGDLTRSEADMLWAQQERIAGMERRMRQDGCLTANERNDLIARLEQASRNIWRERHDNERRGYHHRPPHGGWNSDRH
ncbi:hypothetical protein [Thiothrix eikelboomii]|uniref:Zinc resistance-associated protein n=1 Tax=Thiothrix eikelboomii TaxID=92487 RepID=A0A1T4WLV7_9GAMM|nr:hypothetical protein [Thiothrix eikelboomii]SKA78322.1 hypothetical protein SAMN02745130_01856 [Thiothrix eikelboomii]